MLYTPGNAPTNKELWRFGYKLTSKKGMVQIDREPERGIIKCTEFYHRTFQTLDVAGSHYVEGSNYLFADTKEEATVVYKQLKSGALVFDDFIKDTAYPLNRDLWLFSDRCKPIRGSVKRIKETSSFYNAFTKQTERVERIYPAFLKYVDNYTIEIFSLFESQTSFMEYSLSHKDAISRYNAIIASIKEHTDKICEKRMI